MSNPDYNYKTNKYPNTIQMAFSFSRLFQNQPMTTIYVIPNNYFDALQKFGGLLSLLGVIDVVLMVLHEQCFERKL